MIKKVFTVQFTGQSIIDRLEEMQEMKGFTTIPETIRYLVTVGLDSVDPAYVRLQREKQASTPLEKIRAKNAIKEAEEEERLAYHAKLCEQLDGRVYDKSGKPFCEYEIVEVIGERVERTKMDVPLNQVSRETVENQYRDLEGSSPEIVRQKVKEIDEKKS